MYGVPKGTQKHFYVSVVHLTHNFFAKVLGGTPLSHTCSNRASGAWDILLKKYYIDFLYDTDCSLLMVVLDPK